MKKIEKSLTEQMIALEEGETFFANYMIPDGIENFAELVQTERGSTKIVPRRDIILVVEELHDSGKGAKHVRFARAARPNGKGLCFAESKKWPKLRAAMLHEKVPTRHSLGGFKFVPLYSDEIAVQNYSQSGSTGWIIRKKDIGGYLKKLPLIVDSGVTMTLWVHKKWIPEGKFDKRLSVFTSATRQWAEPLEKGQGMNKIEVDTGSRRVVRIINMEFKKEISRVEYDHLRYVRIGDRVPEYLLQR